MIPNRRFVDRIRNIVSSESNIIRPTLLLITGFSWQKDQHRQVGNSENSAHPYRTILIPKQHPAKSSPLPAYLLLQLQPDLLKLVLDVQQQRVILELAGERPVLQVLHQALRYEVRELGLVQFRDLESRWRVARYLEEGPHRVQLGERRIALGKFDGGYAHGPDVAARVIGRVQLLLARYHLEQGAVHRLPLGWRSGFARYGLTRVGAIEEMVELYD